MNNKEKEMKIKDLTHKENKHLDIMEVNFGNEVVFKRNESSRWLVPEVGERYYFINDFDVVWTTNREFVMDRIIFNEQRVFKTYEEAEKRLRQQQATLSVERWIAENDAEVDVYDMKVKKYFVTYDVVEKELAYISAHYSFYVPKQFILSSKEKAKQLIKECEKELKIMFGVEE